MICGLSIMQVNVKLSSYDKRTKKLKEAYGLLWNIMPEKIKKRCVKRFWLYMCR